MLRWSPCVAPIRLENIFIFPGVPELMVQSFEHMAHELKVPLLFVGM